MKDHSQNGEQKIILDYFGAERGTVLDIGANDGVLLSNSRALVELGWNAVLVEPAEVAFRKLCDNSFSGALRMPDGKAFGDILTLRQESLRTDGSTRTLTAVNAAITTQDGPLTFYSSGTHLHKGDTDLLSTTRPEELARWKKSGEQFTRTTVRGITFSTLLKECGLYLSSVPDYTDAIPPEVARFDFISIDAEGEDWNILKQIDLTAVGCRLLCVEVNQRGDAEFTAYAKRHGMRLLWQSFENRIYCR